jgi:plastocyanin
MCAAVPEIVTPRLLPRLAVLAMGLALAGAACAPASAPPAFPVAQGGQFTLQVPDATYDVGRSPIIGLDSKGQPAVSYLLYQSVPKAGVLPVPIVAGAPQPPAVMLATEANGIWTRTSVTPQKGAPAEGDAPQIATAKNEAIAGVAVSLAVDAGGKHHVAWSTPKGGVFYSDDTAGSFTAPDQISSDQAFGVSIAVGTDGTPWVAWDRGVTVDVATRSAGKWTTEDVANIGGAAGVTAVGTAIEVGSDGQPLVVYGDDGTTKFAQRSTTGWTNGSVPGPGGYALSMTLAKDGTMRLAYYDAQGGVHVAKSANSDGPLGAVGWSVEDVASTAPGPGGKADSRWGTGIAVDDQSHVDVTWADTQTGRVMFAQESNGSFPPSALPGSHGGATPSIAVSADGKQVAVAWFDTTNQNLEVATSPPGGLALAHSPRPYPSITQAAATGGPACEPGGTALKIDAPNGASGSGFDVKCLAAPAGTAFTVDFTNNDTNVHNFAIYDSDPVANPAAKLLGGAPSAGDVVSGGGSITYNVDALKAGTYFFHCDVHPTTMTGQFVVAKA